MYITKVDATLCPLLHATNNLGHFTCPQPHKLSITDYKKIKLYRIKLLYYMNFVYYLSKKSVTSSPKIDYITW